MPANRNLSNVIVGTVANDGTGDLLRDAFIKVNNNFNDVFSGGQFLGQQIDTRFLPTYSWLGDKDTGIYRPGSGKIAFSLNARDSLVLDENGSISWFGAALATQAYVSQLLNSSTGGASPGTITVVGGGEGGTSVTVNGIPVVNSLTTAGNFEGRIAFFNGDVWIYHSYPPGNGAGSAPNPSIAREQGSDSRWVRFRGDLAIPTGATRPDTAPEGSMFYRTTDDIIFVFFEGSWKTLSSIVTSNSPSGLEVLSALPLTSDSANYQGRTVVVNNTISIFISDAWKNLNEYVTGGAGAGGGIASAGTFPAVGDVGVLFRKLDTNAGLYISDGTNWLTLSAFTSSQGTARIKTESALPTNLGSYNPGDVIRIENVFYILNSNKSNWDVFAPGSGGVFTVSISADSVDTAQIKNGAVTGDKIASQTITGARLALNTVGSESLKNNSIISSKIDAASVTNEKLADGSVTEGKLAGDSVSTTKIQNIAITSDKLRANCVTAGKILVPSLSVINTNIGTITKGKLQSTDGKLLIDLDNKIFRIEI